MENVLNNKPNAIGTGLVKGTARTFKRRKEWRNKYINGETTLQYREWMKKEKENVSNMPRSSHN